MLEKVIKIDQIEVIENGTIQVRTATIIYDDGNEVSRTFHRHAIAPNQDCSLEDERVKAICQAVHTPEVIEEYLSSINTNTPITN